MTETAFTLETLTTVLGWCLVINLGLMLLNAFFVKVSPRFLHASQRMWFPDVSDHDVDMVVYAYMGMFKIFVIIFNLVPYIALRIVLG